MHIPAPDTLPWSHLTLQDRSAAAGQHLQKLHPPALLPVPGDAGDTCGGSLDPCQNCVAATGGDALSAAEPPDPTQVSGVLLPEPGLLCRDPAKPSGLDLGGSAWPHSTGRAQQKAERCWGEGSKPLLPGVVGRLLWNKHPIKAGKNKISLPSPVGWEANSSISAWERAVYVSNRLTSRGEGRAQGRPAPLPEGLSPASRAPQGLQ